MWALLAKIHEIKGWRKGLLRLRRDCALTEICNHGEPSVQIKQILQKYFCSSIKQKGGIALLDCPEFITVIRNNIAKKKIFIINVINYTNK